MYFANYPHFSYPGPRQGDRLQPGHPADEPVRAHAERPEAGKVPGVSRDGPQLLRAVPGQDRDQDRRQDREGEFLNLNFEFSTVIMYSTAI